MRHKLLAVERRLDQFLKATQPQQEPPTQQPPAQTNQKPNPNPYLLALLATKGFASFASLFENAIAEQAEWSAKGLLALADNILSGDNQLSADQVAKLEAWLYDSMPQISDLISSEDVDKWLNTVVNRGVNGLYDALGSPINFNLTDNAYKQRLAQQAETLLTKSTLDTTTRKQIADLIIKDRSNNMTVAEVSKGISTQFKGISSVRANMIARTETVNTLNASQFEVMKRSGAAMKKWVPFGNAPCPICSVNEAQGWLKMDEVFASGDLTPAAHTRCECGLDYQLGDVDNLWDGAGQEIKTVELEQIIPDDLVKSLALENKVTEGNIRQDIKTLSRNVAILAGIVKNSQQNDLATISTRLDEVLAKSISENESLRKTTESQHQELTKAFALLYGQMLKSNPQLTDPKDASSYINARLTDGKDFYRAVDKMVAAVSEGYNGPQGLITQRHDAVYATYPDSVTTILTYKLQGNTVATLTNVYTDSTKQTISSMVLS